MRLLWRESAELLRVLHERYPQQHSAIYSRTLYHLGTYLCRTGCWERAEKSLRDASRLHRERFNADSASKRNCVHLAITLREHATSLETLGRDEEAQRITQEAHKLLRRLFEAHHGGLGSDLPAVMRGYGDFLFLDQGLASGSD